MIISHRHKFAYFRVPKTGSSSMEAAIRLCGSIDDRDIASPMPLVAFPSLGLGPEWDNVSGQSLIELNHCVPQQAIDWGFITLEQLREYRVFVTVREPLDRHISMFAHLTRVGIFPVIVQKMIKEKYELHLLARPTKAYFTVGTETIAEPLDFDDFEDELRRMLTYIGGFTFPTGVMRLNNSSARDPATPVMDYFDEESEALSRAQFADDIVLHAQMKAGTL